LAGIDANTAEDRELSFRMMLPEEDIRALFECLHHLGLTQDAQHVAKAWAAVQRWMIGPWFDEQLSEWATSRPEEAPHLRQRLGAFPSAEQIAASAQERRSQEVLIGMEARRLAKILKHLHEAYVGPLAGPTSESPRQTAVPDGDDSSQEQPIVPANESSRQTHRRRPPLRNAQRDAWVARQRAKRMPAPWQEIYDEGLRLATEKRWRMPGSPKALEEAHRRYLKRQRQAEATGR
jgi:hypothetical protein